MSTFRFIPLAAAVVVSLGAYAQPAPDSDPHHPDGTAVPAAPAASASPRDGTPFNMAQFQERMQAMQAMHEKMAAARTPAERQALMGGQMQLMQQGMAMMGGMAGGPGSTMGMGMGAMPGPGAAADPQLRQQMMERRLDMMQSMMQMMVDRMQAQTPATNR